MKPPIVDEQKSVTLTIGLSDAAGNPAPPVTVTYQIDCLTSGTQVLDPVTLATPGAQFDVALSSVANRIVDQTHAQEYRRLTVEAQYATGNLLTGQFDWVVNNLSFVS